MCSEFREGSVPQLRLETTALDHSPSLNGLLRGGPIGELSAVVWIIKKDAKIYVFDYQGK